jgi:hypothetical protein
MMNNGMPMKLDYSFLSLKGKNNRINSLRRLIEIQMSTQKNTYKM